MIWECKTCFRCECNAVDSVSFKPEWLTKLGMALVDDATTSHFQLIKIWKKIAHKYTRLSLTYDGDRLAALSGLAASFENKSLGQYIAGMWAGMLPQALDWHMDWVTWEMVEAIKLGLITPDKWRDYALSWSWRSVGCPFEVGPLNTVGGRNRCSEFKLLAADFDLMTQNPYGDVQNAKLMVRARCMEFSV